MSSSLTGSAAKGGRKTSGRRSGGRSKSAEQVGKENCLVGDTYAFDDADANGDSPCVESKLPLGELGVSKTQYCVLVLCVWKRGKGRDGPF